MQRVYRIFLLFCSCAVPFMQPQNIFSQQPFLRNSLNPLVSESAKPAANQRVKPYAQLSDQEKSLFIAEQSNKILNTFGRTPGDQITPEGLASIKKQVDGYAARTMHKDNSRCSYGDDLPTLLGRGAKYSKTLTDAFTNQQLPAQLGIYTAMIESEFCPDARSGTGALGMFQLTYPVAGQFGLKAIKGGTPKDADERLHPSASAQASARYYHTITTSEFGGVTDARSYPLAIAAFNSGEVAFRQNVSLATSAKENEKTSFWALLETRDKLNAQFRSENSKYVPRFFAAWIVGENPDVFGVNSTALSKPKGN